MAIQRIKVPNRRLDKISINTANILQGVEKELQDKGQPLSTSRKIKLSSIDSSFKDVGFGLYSQSYKNQDYGKIWVKKTFIDEKTGEKQDWLVVYENDNGEIERQAGLSKAASVFHPYTEENEFQDEDSGLPEDTKLFRQKIEDGDVWEEYYSPSESMEYFDGENYYNSFGQQLRSSRSKDDRHSFR